MAQTAWSWKSGIPYDTTGKPSPRTWHRRLWAGEMLFAQASLDTPGRGDIILSAIIQSPKELTHTHVRGALRKFRYLHPSIATKVAWQPPPAPPNVAEALLEYTSPANEEELSAWLDTVLHFHKSDEKLSVSQKLEQLQLDLSRADTPRTDDVMHVHHIEANADDAEHHHGVLLYLRHVIFDGVAAWQALECIIRQIVDALAEKSDEAALTLPLEWGKEHEHLARPPSDRSLIPWTPADLHSDWPLIKNMLANISKQSTSFGLPVPHLDAPSEYTSFFTASFTPEETRMLTAACRTHGVKFFSLQLASIVIACRRLTDPPTDGPQQVVLPYNSVNIRPYMLPQTLVEEEPELVSALGYNTIAAEDLNRFKGAKSTDVWVLARELQKQQNDQEPWLADIPRCAPMAMKELVKVIFANPPPQHPLRIFGMTNFGLLDSVLPHSYAIPGGVGGHLYVKDAQMRGVMIHVPQSLLPVLMHAYTWQGVLNYSFSYSPTHMGTNGGENEQATVGKATLISFIEELKKLTRELTQTITVAV